MAGPNRVSSAATNPSPASDKKPFAGLDFRGYQELKSGLHRYLANNTDLEKIPDAPDDRMRAQLLAIIQDVVAHLKAPFSEQERQTLSVEMLEEVLGLGPLEPLLKDPAVSDILVNGANEVYVERGGVLEETKVSFKDNNHLLRIVNKIVSAIGRRVDESSPMVDARLADGSRVNVILPPLALDGPHLSIRRFGQIPVGESDLLANQSLNTQMLGLLKAAVTARLNIVISGGTGAGKTTLLNVLSGYITAKERSVTIEA